MSERDDELDRLLKPLMEIKPNRAQISRWQSSVSKIGRSRWPIQVVQAAAAAFVGFLIGAWYFTNHQSNQQVADNFDATATIEMIYSKSE
jgi:hypothetical protein